MFKNLTILSFLFFSSLLFSQEGTLTGIASFYHNMFVGRLTANGEIFTQSKFTAAHKTLPFGTMVKVTNLANDKSVVVRINDRGPFVEGRVIDLSKTAARKLGYIKKGVTKVKLKILGEDYVNNKATKERDINIREHEYFSLTSKPNFPNGFSVQLRGFDQPVNLVRLVSKLEKLYHKKVTVQIKSIDPGIDLYYILLGAFKKRKPAEKFKEKIIEKYPGSFVVDFSEINEKLSSTE